MPANKAEPHDQRGMGRRTRSYRRPCVPGLGSLRNSCDSVYTDMGYTRLCNLHFASHIDTVAIMPRKHSVRTKFESRRHCVMNATESKTVNTADKPEQDCGPKIEPQKEHQWLQRLVGEWTCEGEAMMKPGEPSIKWKATEDCTIHRRSMGRGRG